jgi:hypothetical protein
MRDHHRCIPPVLAGGLLGVYVWAVVEIITWASFPEKGITSMIGKHFKAWASTIHDDAIVEVKKEDRDYHEFLPLDPRLIRARSISSPNSVVEETEQVEP